MYQTDSWKLLSRISQSRPPHSGDLRWPFTPNRSDIPAFIPLWCSDIRYSLQPLSFSSPLLFPLLLRDLTSVYPTKAHFAAFICRRSLLVVLVGFRVLFSSIFGNKRHYTATLRLIHRNPTCCTSFSTHPKIATQYHTMYRACAAGWVTAE